MAFRIKNKPRTHGRIEGPGWLQGDPLHRDDELGRVGGGGGTGGLWATTTSGGPKVGSNDTSFASDADYQTWVLDSSGAVQRKLSYSSDEHIDTTLNSAGQDVLVGVQFDTPVVGNIVVANLETGAVSTLVGQSTGYGYPRGESFVSGTAYLNSSWVAGAAVGEPYGTKARGSLTPSWGRCRCVAP
jgi:hypothetical protein